MRTSVWLSLIFVIAAPAQDFVSRADTYVEAYVRQGKFRGGVLVGKDGKPLFRKAYGPADAEWDIPNTPDTKFRIGSITKQFTGMAILQLVEAGKVKIDDPVKKYYEEAP